jgi:hypothetical protein
MMWRDQRDHDQRADLAQRRLRVQLDAGTSNATRRQGH